MQISSNLEILEVQTSLETSVSIWLSDSQFGVASYLDSEPSLGQELHPHTDQKVTGVTRLPPDFDLLSRSVGRKLRKQQRFPSILVLSDLDVLSGHRNIKKSLISWHRGEGWCSTRHWTSGCFTNWSPIRAKCSYCSSFFQMKWFKKLGTCAICWDSKPRRRAYLAKSADFDLWPAVYPSPWEISESLKQLGSSELATCNCFSGIHLVVFFEFHVWWDLQAVASVALKDRNPPSFREGYLSYF